MTTPHPKPGASHTRAAVDLSPDLMKGLTRLFGRKAIMLEAEA